MTLTSPIKGVPILQNIDYQLFFLYKVLLSKNLEQDLLAKDKMQQQ